MPEMAAGSKKPPDRGEGDRDAASSSSSQGGTSPRPAAAAPPTKFGRRLPFASDRHHNHNHHNHHSSRHHAAPSSRSEYRSTMGAAVAAVRREPKKLVLLSDLDYVRPTITIAVRPGVGVAKIDGAVRKYLAGGISDDEMLWFYSDGVELAPGDTVDPRKSLYYRVTPAAAVTPNKRLRITFETASLHKRELFAELEPELTQDALAGKTVGELRRKIAERIGIPDPDTVFIVARGGMRPGALFGSSWEARQVQKWLCQWLAIEVCPNASYIVLRGFGREYLYHPWQPGDLGVMVRDAKEWMERKLFANVHQKCNSQVEVRAADIKIFRRGKRLHRGSSIPWGSTVEFDIPASVEKAFSKEEAWLYPVDRDCIVCGNDRRLPEMPYQITKKCAHEIMTCRDCLEQWISSSIDIQEWDRLRCPECSELLGFYDVKTWASSEIFERYDKLATKSALRNEPDFVWCLEPGCNSGQFHPAPPDCTKFVCHACKGRHCTRHGVKWHTGQTCQEYDKNNKAKLKQDKASEAKIKEISKECPECKRPVNKFTGCNHITCVCGHEWCYICFEPWRRNPNNGFLTCEHTSTCPERNNNPFLFDEILMDLPLPPRPWNHMRRGAGGPPMPFPHAGHAAVHGRVHLDERGHPFRHDPHDLPGLHALRPLHRNLEDLVMRNPFMREPPGMNEAAAAAATAEGGRAPPRAPPHRARNPVFPGPAFPGMPPPDIWGPPMMGRNRRFAVNTNVPPHPHPHPHPPPPQDQSNPMQRPQTAAPAPPPGVGLGVGLGVGVGAAEQQQQPRAARPPPLGVVPPPVPMPDMFEDEADYAHMNREDREWWQRAFQAEEEDAERQRIVHQRQIMLDEMERVMEEAVLRRGPSPNPNHNRPPLPRFPLPYPMEYRPPTPPRSQARF